MIYTLDFIAHTCLFYDLVKISSFGTLNSNSGSTGILFPFINTLDTVEKEFLLLTYDV